MVYDDKISRFITEITKQAQKMSEDINRQTDEFIKEELNRIELKLLDENNRQIEETSAEILRSSGIKISKYQIESKKSKVEHRNALMESVFEDVKKKLRTFRESQDYQLFIEQSVKHIKSIIPDGENVVVYINESDMKFSDNIKSVFGYPVTVETDNSILYGGIKAYCDSKKISIDDTIDCRLNEQRDKFREKTELYID